MGGRGSGDRSEGHHQFKCFSYRYRYAEKLLTLLRMPTPLLDIFCGVNFTLGEDSVTSSKLRQRETRLFFFLTAVGLFFVALFFYNAPALMGESCEGVSAWWVIMNGRDPGSVEKAMRCAQDYKKEHEGFLLLGYILTYVTFQSFAIPGGMCLLLNILAGAVFPFFMAELLVMFCATTGATFSFLISSYLGRGVISFYGFDPMLEDYRKKVNDNRHRLFMFLVLTRCTPVPSVLINIASPLLDVPIYTFIGSTIIGQVPLNSVHMLAGYSMAQTGRFQAGSLKWIMLVGVAITTYVLFGHKIKR